MQNADAAFLDLRATGPKLTHYLSAQRPGRSGVKFAMRQAPSTVEFGPAPRRVGAVWSWIATHPTGQQEEVVGFHSEAEARQWRTSNGLRARFRTRGDRIEGAI